LESAEIFSSEVSKEGLGGLSSRPNSCHLFLFLLPFIRSMYSAKSQDTFSRYVQENVGKYEKNENGASTGRGF
jgi:hypothetical protein